MSATANIPLDPSLLAGTVNPDAVKQLLYGQRVPLPKLIGRGDASNAPGTQVAKPAPAQASGDTSPATLAPATEAGAAKPAANATQGGTSDQAPPTQSKGPMSLEDWMKSPAGQAEQAKEQANAPKGNAKPYGFWKRVGIGTLGAMQDFGREPGAGQKFITDQLAKNKAESTQVEDYNKALPGQQDKAYQSYLDRLKEQSQITAEQTTTARTQQEIDAAKAQEGKKEVESIDQQYAAAVAKNDPAEITRILGAMKDQAAAKAKTSPADAAGVQEIERKLKLLKEDPKAFAKLYPKSIAETRPGETEFKYWLYKNDKAGFDAIAGDKGEAAGANKLKFLQQEKDRVYNEAQRNIDNPMTDPADREIAKTDLGKKMKEFDDQIAAEKNRQGQGGAAPQNTGGPPAAAPAQAKPAQANEIPAKGTFHIGVSKKDGKEHNIEADGKGGWIDHGPVTP